jgi:hypothetical protein
VALASADIVIIEFGTNDSDGGFMPLPTGFLDKSKKVQYWTEALINLLKLKCPEAALIYLEAGAWDWKLHVSNRHPRPAPPYQKERDGHLDVLKYYDITQIDMMRMIGPLGTEEKDHYMSVYFMDIVHPGRWGHSLMASALSFTLREMVANIPEIEADFKVAEPTLEQNRKFLVLPEDWVPLLASFSVSFMEPNMLEKHTNIKGDGQVTNGWSYDTGKPGKDKMLMSKEQGSCVDINNVVVKDAITEFSVVVMKSYENFGLLSIALLCGEQTMHVETVNCTWESQTSQFSTLSFKLEEPLVGCKEVHFELCHLKSDSPTKVKVQKLSIFKASK